METWGWIVVAIAAVVVLAVVAYAVGQRQKRQRTQHLRGQFGEEYERVTAQAGDDRRAAEAELRRREMRRAHLDIRPLPPDARQRYRSQWQSIQGSFVDEPERSVAEAEELVNRVMRDRGYPVADEFDNQAELISVDHPDLVSNYRQAHGVFERSRQHQADTEELRSSLVYYRSLFDELLAA